MKHSTMFSCPSLSQSSRAVLLFMFLITLLVTNASPAGTPQVRPLSMRERAMNAAQQLREVRQEVRRSKERESGISSVHSEVQIRIDRAAKTSSTIFFYDNMESGGNGWTSVAYTGADLWHQTTMNSGSSSHSWWPGIEIQANYDNGTRINNAILSPAINLTSAVAPIELLFTENYATERGWDYCMVDASTDGGTSWTHLRGGYGSAPTGSSDGWIITTLDLSAFAGQNVNLRFYFDTGDERFNDFPGWFVDDVVIFDQGGTITGKKFFDVNNNSVKDPGERGVKNWLITATGPITLTTKTNYRGRYRMTLPLGSYSVSEAFEPNWTQTYPLSGQWAINLTTPDTLVDSLHFGNYIHASFINGIKFHDLNNNNSFDGGDTLLPEWKIVLSDTSGNQIDYDFTDSLGQYSLYVFQPGTYVVKEVEKAGWLQTYPAGETYQITIPDLSTVSNNNDFGNYYSPLTNSILGMKFDDRNRSHSFDPGELGLADFKIQIYRKGTGNNFNLYKTRTTDSSGFYQFLSVPPDTYRVKEVPRQGWWQSYPDSFYYLELNNGETLDSVDFGNYEIVPGSVAGLKYGDLNDDGIQDSSESGLSDWHVIISGSTYFNSSVSLNTTTDGSGNYSFSGIWPGNYVVSEVWRSGWRQTEPANLAPHFINLGVEENRTGLNFGNTPDTNFSTSFRTFMPENLALALDKKGKHKPVKRAPDKVQFWVTFKNDTTLPASKLTARFSVALLDSMESTKPGIQLLNDKKNRVEFTFDSPLNPGDSVTLSGFGVKPKPEVIPKWWWTFSDLTQSHIYFTPPIVQYLRWPMPNAINLLSDDPTGGHWVGPGVHPTVGSGLKVGLGGPHTVLHTSWKDVMKSLVERNDRMHIGDARCLDKYAGTTRSIKKQQKSLTPTKGNNRLFAELVALQANIRGSDFTELPGGFGNLVFDDTSGGGSPLNGFTIREIAAKADSFMSSYKDTIPPIPCAMPATLAGFLPESLFATIRKIDSAFAGPIDTLSFAQVLRLTPVAPLSSVPFLRYDPLAAQRTSFAATPPQSAYLPDVFALNQNYPNPFNPTTVISFQLPVSSWVTIKIYNILGQEVTTLLNREEMDDGDQEVELNASNMPSGVYFYQIRAEGIPDEDEGVVAKTYTAVRKMVLLK